MSARGLDSVSCDDAPHPRAFDSIKIDAATERSSRLGATRTSGRRSPARECVPAALGPILRHAGCDRVHAREPVHAAVRRDGLDARTSTAPPAPRVTRRWAISRRRLRPRREAAPKRRSTRGLWLLASLDGCFAAVYVVTALRAAPAEERSSMLKFLLWLLLVVVCWPLAVSHSCSGRSCGC